MVNNDDIASVRAFLYRTWVAQKQLEADCDLRQRLRSIANKITPTLSQAPCHSSDQDKLAGVVAKIVDLDAQITNDIDVLVKVITDSREIINSVENEKYRLNLHLRYLSFKRWEEIAVIIGIGYRGCCKSHIKALKMAAKTKKYQEILKKGHRSSYVKYDIVKLTKL